jgi:uncharacterized membrane protein YhhN
MKVRPTPIIKLKQIILAHISYPTHHQQNIILSIFLGIIAILILVVLGYLAMCYRRIRGSATIPVDNSHSQGIE